MNTKIALFIAGTILLLVALTMGEGGTVSQIADRGAATEKGQMTEEAPAKAAPTPAARQTPRVASDWYAPASQGSKPEIPVYHYQEVHIPVPQAVVDPKVAAASPIQ